MAMLWRGISKGQLLNRCKLIYVESNQILRDSVCKSRGFKSSCPVLGSFNIQDFKDFSKRVLESPIPVIVDFHADWCGPCKMLAPRLESVIDTYGEQLHFAKVNIDDNTELAIQYGVDAVPCVIGFRQGRQIEKFVGLVEADVIKSFVDKVIGPKPQ